MWLKPALSFAAAALIAVAPLAAAAQEAPPAAAAHPSYSDAQMGAFARATVELQALGSQDPDAQSRAIERSGISVEDYNSMGDAMRGDPRLAASLTPYLDQANAERRARVGYIPPSAARYAPPRRQVVTASRHVRASHHRAMRGHGRHHAAKATHGKHGKASRHTSSRRAHVVKKTRGHATSHTVVRHKRHRR